MKPQFLGFLLAVFLPASANSIGAADAIRKGDFARAREIASRQLQSSPNDVELWNLLGIADTELHQNAAARKAFERGLKLVPNSVSLNENLGFLFYREGDFGAAKKYLERAVALGSVQPGVRFSLAASRLRTGESAEALRELQAIETEFGGVSDYWEERGRAELSTNSASAGTSFDRALVLKPGSPDALRGAAYAAEKQGLDEKALSYLIQARTAEPNDVGTLAHFGAVCIRRDLGPDALEALEKAHKLDPGNNGVLYLLARANISLQNWQRSYELFHQFSNRAPRFAPTYYAMGWLAERLNNNQDARRQLEHCVQLDPSLVDARVELARLEIEDGRAEEAERSLRNVLKQTPDHAAANLAMADMELRRGELDAAESCLRKALAKDPSLAAAHYRLATVLQRKHQSEEGQRELAAATALNAEAKEGSRTQLRLVLPEQIH